MKKKDKLLQLLIVIALLLFPFNTLAYSEKIVVGGDTIGIEVHSKGVLIVDFYEVNGKFLAKDAGFQIGDIITKVDGKEVSGIESLTEQLENKEGKVSFTVERNGKVKEIEMSLEKDENNVLKTGLYIKDQINGVGTLSYIDPETKIFGSLGHEIIERATISKFEIKDGEIYEASVSNIIKSEDGKAGEKNSIYNRDNVYGTIKENEVTGIFGKYTEDFSDKEMMSVGNTSDIHTGKASIRTVINNNDIEEFSIEIISLNDNSKTKNILFEITDERLLKETGGVIQGMSGSPIIQDEKIIGAVNYVIVNDPKRGYGIFITTMLEEGEN